MEKSNPMLEETDNLMFEAIEEENQNDVNINQLETAKQLIDKSEIRRINIPQHRLTPLKTYWEKIVALLVEKLHLLVRMNVKRKCVELKPSEALEDKLNLQRGSDFIKAFSLGFELNDAIALLRLDDLYIDSFEIKDVKNLHGENLSRAIGRIVGDKGKTKNAIENSTKTRIVVAESKIHILGSFSNIKFAKNAICSLILGSPANKIYSQLRYAAKRKGI